MAWVGAGVGSLAGLLTSVKMARILDWTSVLVLVDGGGEGVRMRLPLSSNSARRASSRVISSVILQSVMVVRIGMWMVTVGKVEESNEEIEH